MTTTYLGNIVADHWEDENENPAGGVSTGTGIRIDWQNGQLAEGRNGAFPEDVITAMLDRMQYYQTTKFSCEANREIIYHLNRALDVVNQRQVDRQARGVAGTHKV